MGVLGVSWAGAQARGLALPGRVRHASSDVQGACLGWEECRKSSHGGARSFPGAQARGLALPGRVRHASSDMRGGCLGWARLPWF